MANKEHLALLREGVWSWNEWRKTNRAIKPDLSGADLKGKDLSGADFSKADLRSANFTGATLIGANFTGAKCGLQKRWATLLITISWLLAGISGFFLIFTRFQFLLIFNSFSSKNQIADLVSLEVVTVVTVVTGVVTVVTGVVTGVGVVLLGAGAVLAVVLNVVVGVLVTGVLGGVVGVLVAVVVGGGVAVVVEAVVAGVESGVLGGVLLGVLEVLGGAVVVGEAEVEENVKYSWVYSFAIAVAATRGTSFRNADLTDANFTFATLKNTDLRKAILTRVRWYKVKMLDLVRPGDTYLKKAQIRQWLIGKGINNNFDGQKLQGINLQEANLRGANLRGANLSEANLSGANLSEANLSGANLSEASLSEASLSEANLSEANLSEASLSEANLSGAQALHTNFEGATFTGACIENWNTNSQTNLNNVICDYIYLKDGKQERRPHDPNKNFAPGEFTKLFQKALETVDLIFSDGVDWQAFLSSFEKLKIECGSDELSIHSFENKGDDTFVIKVNVPYDADKAEIEKYLKKQYQLEAQLEAKSEQLAKLYEITKLLASKPIHVEAKAVAENQSSSETFNTDLRQANVANFANKLQDNARQQANQHNDAPEQKQTLAEAAAEIQQLLTQLQSQGCSPEEAQQQAANDLATKAKDNPTTLGKLVRWGQSLGDTAAQTTVSEAAKEVVKLALRLSGVPLP
jgi:uncharacterized protein YjbI with pentapeptide repeats